MKAAQRQIERIDLTRSCRRHFENVARTFLPREKDQKNDHCKYPHRCRHIRVVNKVCVLVRLGLKWE